MASTLSNAENRNNIAARTLFALLGDGEIQSFIVYVASDRQVCTRDSTPREKPARPLVQHICCSCEMFLVLEIHPEAAARSWLLAAGRGLWMDIEDI